MSLNGPYDGDTVAREQVPPQNAALRRGHIGMAEEYEGKDASVAVGNGEECSLLRGLMGQLDRLEESQSTIQGQLSGEARVNKIALDAQMSPGEVLNLFASGLGRGPRMHIDALSGKPSPDKAGRTAAHQRHFVHQQPGYGLPRSKLQHLTLWP
uniref:AlNc14C197G8582 protein n=1 Tax=Albugo laibachii Nc14 TaxID=890382 RepID=F0WQA1_9STRA|nr:AlNc14C197G8582 [Albugo laibachii Nc14]|eukprot:CCA23509.1 AlNc14C197G8582 [Albugo laibachii Nc14]